jgi:hypothetical protein
VTAIVPVTQTSALSMQPPYLNTCSYDAFGHVTGYTCDYQNRPEGCFIQYC